MVLQVSVNITREDEPRVEKKKEMGEVGNLEHVVVIQPAGSADLGKLVGKSWEGLGLEGVEYEAKGKYGELGKIV